MKDLIHKKVGSKCWNSIWVELGCQFNLLTEDSIWDSVADSIRSIQTPISQFINDSIARINNGHN